MICGIDPGASGAIAWLSDDGALIDVRDLPVATSQGHTLLMVGVFADWLREVERMPDRIILERISPMPASSKSACMSLARQAGQIEGVAASLGIALDLVMPAKWKRDLRIPKDKSASRYRAQQLWPSWASEFARVKDDGRAEAALIGLHGTYGVTTPPRLRLAAPALPL